MGFRASKTNIEIVHGARSSKNLILRVIAKSQLTFIGFFLPYCEGSFNINENMLKT